MTQEAKTLFYGILTLVMYAASIFFTQGAFIFPFPLNEFVFLVIALSFLVLNWHKHKWVGMLPVVAGICGVLSTQIFWTFIYDQLEMIEFMKGLTTDYFLLAFYVLILIAGIATLIKQRTTLALVLGCIFLCAFVLGVLYNHPLFLLLAYASMIVSTQIRHVYAPFHLLWILLFALKLTEWLTFFLNS